MSNRVEQSTRLRHATEQMELSGDISGGEIKASPFISLAFHGYARCPDNCEGAADGGMGLEPDAAATSCDETRDTWHVMRIDRNIGVSSFPYKSPM